MFEYNEKQREAIRLIRQNKHILLRGGSRSGKTFVFCRALIVRAGKAPGSRHVIFRHRFQHCKHLIGMDTLPAVFKKTAPDINYNLNKTDWVFELPNGSEIWLAGLDDKERTEKILGSEYSTIYFNEISQIGYDEILIAKTRLAQKVVCENGDLLENRAFYDCNPPSTKHWSYKVFIKGVDPSDGRPVGEGYGTALMNPHDNLRNIAPDFIQQLEKLPNRHRQRFLHGEYVDVVEGALWAPELFIPFEAKPRFTRIVIGVDPSGSKHGDEVGIIVCGIDTLQNIYVLADRSGNYTPYQWGTIIKNEVERWKADAVVVERNFGGDMVVYTIRSVDPSIRVIDVSASRGKDVRAEPVLSLYEQGQVFHAPGLGELENEMLTWVPGLGQSPNRIDGLVWAITELTRKHRLTGGKFRIPK